MINVYSPRRTYNKLVSGYRKNFKRFVILWHQINPTSIARRILWGIALCVNRMALITFSQYRSIIILYPGSGLLIAELDPVDKFFTEPSKLPFSIS